MHRIIIVLVGLVSMGLSTFAQAQMGSGTGYDWDDYPIWENTTQYSRTWVVNQRHPRASDDNEGTTDAPLKTINAAAQRAEAGERILIYPGVYREMIEPKHEGIGPDQMISYEAVPGGEVVVKGSRVFDPVWEQRKVLTDVLPDPEATYTWSRRVWVAELPDTLFAEDYFPFQLPNILPEEHLMMPWARLVKDLAPWNSTRGIIWQDGRRLTQVEDYDDVAKVPGSFWVDVDGKTLHLHAFGSENPSSSLIEVGVQSHLVRPQAIGMGYLQFRGITFEQCANGFLRTSTGAIWAKGGHHWIVEGNTIREINSSGLEFGYFAYEIEDTRPEAEWPRQDDDLGGMIIRNNEIHDCGTAGMRSFVLTDARVLNNHVYRCGWQDAENYWEVSGIKLLKTTRTLVAGNRVHDIQGGNGIWMDWDIQHSRVTRNIIYNVQCIQGGIFVEASQTPNLVDHNFLWNIDGNGIYANDSDNQLIHYNVVAHTTGPLVNSVVATERKLNGRWLTANHNTITHNLFIDGGAPVTYGGEGNVSDYNWLVTTRPPADFSVVAEQQAGRESHSVTSFSLVEFNPETLLFQWDVGGEVPQFALPADAPLAQQLGESVVPGPFHQLRPKGKLLLPEEF